MLNKITSGLSDLGAAMQLRSKRNEAITSNIANQDTPEYKARDFDFAKAMSNATGLSMRLSGSAIDNGPRLEPVSLAVSSQAHIAPSFDKLDSSIDRLYRTPAMGSLDGNTVDPELERAAFAENLIKYEASLKAFQSHIETMRDAMDASKR